MIEKLTTYLCSIKSGKVNFENFSGDIDAIEINDGLVEVGLWPVASFPGCQANAGKIIAPLLNENNSRHVCPNGDYLDWYREEILDVLDVPVGLRHYITIEVYNSDHCHWFFSFIMIYGAHEGAHGRVFGWVTVGPGGGACPEEKKDVFSGGVKSYFLMTQNQIVPGELISLQWTFWDTEYTDEREVDAKWFCTCCFTGGRVISINGSYGDTSLTYTVNIQGINRTCVPSDFVEYEVDDWVFVLTPNSTCAESGRVEACKEGCEESENYMILPMKVGDYGP
jgi:hypothetical protein